MCGTLTQKFLNFILDFATSEPRRQLNETAVERVRMKEAEDIKGQGNRNSKYIIN